MRVLVAMSGGVDSSVAAAEMIAAGHEVAGATLRLWGGESDSGCCSVADVDDARRVAQQLDIPHYVFNYSDDFDTHVVDPYVAAHQQGLTPNPCIECNRHIKFDRFLQRADQLGFDAIATGHHVRRVDLPNGIVGLGRAEDAAKDQTYVVHMLDQAVLSRCLFPIGEMTKLEVRERAAALGLRTADKPESMDVCFIAKTGGGRRVFLGNRIPFRSAKVVDVDGSTVGEVDAVELVTIGQRKGLGAVGHGEKRYVVNVDVANQEVMVGRLEDLLVSTTSLHTLTFAVDPTFASGDVLIQVSAHSEVVDGTFDSASGLVTYSQPRQRVAPGQTVVLYKDNVVVGGGIAS